MTKEISTKVMEDALRKSHGNLKVAAQIIGCNRETIRLRASKTKYLADIISEEREAIIDIAESALYNKVLEGDMRAIEFTLKTIGKDRGYSEKVDVNQTGKLIITFEEQDAGLL